VTPDIALAPARGSRPVGMLLFSSDPCVTILARTMRQRIISRSLNDARAV
jgi:hypothetical protein